MTGYDASLRPVADMLCLWALCGKQSCRRAQRCKRDARDCLTRWSPLVPEEARIGALAVAQGQKDGVGIEVVRMYEPAGLAAIESWRAQVYAAAGDGQLRETVDHER